MLPFRLLQLVGVACVQLEGRNVRGLVYRKSQYFRDRNFRGKKPARVQQDLGYYLFLYYALGFDGELPHQDEEGNVRKCFGHFIGADQSVFPIYPWLRMDQN